MKKGLILALTMVAMVALVLPASAIAPIIEPLPGVVIGDAGDTDGSGATIKHLFRYTNIMNIADSDKITWGNVDLGFGNDQKHAYYMSTPTGQIQASTAQRLVTEITAGDIAAMESTGARPAFEKEITDNGGNGGTPDFFWLSLANNMSAATNAYTATAAANGRLLSEYTTLAPAVVTLVLADGDFPTTAVAQADFDVYTVAGEEDGFSGGGVQVYAEGFSADANGWFWKFDNPGGGILSTPAGVWSGGALTMQRGTNSSAIYYGTWASGLPGGVSGAEPVVPVTAADMTGSILRATFTMTSSAANAVDTPGFRLFYLSEAFTHLGGISAVSGAWVGSSVLGPNSSAPKDIKVYWTPQFAFSEMGDSGKLATVTAGNDLRDYFINFDMIGYEGSDSGILGLSNVLVEKIARPDSGTALVKWGGSDNAFNGSLSTFGWNNSNQDASGGLGLGTANIGATSIVLNAISANNAGYKAVGLFANASALPAWQSAKLIRMSTTIANSAADNAPTFRILTLAVKPTDGGGLAPTWVDAFGSDVARSVWTPSAGDNVAPPAGGAAVETYIYTHTAGAGADAGVLAPQIDCYATGLQSGWPAQSANLTISKVDYVECLTQ